MQTKQGFTASLNQQELQDCLTIAQKWRVTKSTYKNNISSRSHLIVQIRISRTVKNQDLQDEIAFCTTLAFVDLAGSEKYSFLLTEETERLKETLSINKR